MWFQQFPFHFYVHDDPKHYISPSSKHHIFQEELFSHTGDVIIHHYHIYYFQRFQSMPAVIVMTTILAPSMNARFCAKHMG